MLVLLIKISNRGTIGGIKIKEPIVNVIISA
jgi:hypothetical protein